MKKIYSKPSLEAHKITVSAFLAASPDVKFDPTQQSSSMDARRGWFDDADDDE
ncbi:MAG: hypothetical protein IJ144_05005 [Prevotella sp.]|nr:hypothetical protein [Prevotella sp.]